MSKGKTTKQQLLALGMKESDFNSHESDLYVRKTPVSENFVKNVYQFPQNVTTFRSDDPKDNGAVFYDIPFAYDEFIIGKEKRRNSKTRADVMHVLKVKGYQEENMELDFLPRLDREFQLLDGLLVVGEKIRQPYKTNEEIYAWIIANLKNIEAKNSLPHKP